MREQIQITAKLYQCQETAKNLFKEEYNERIQWYINLINDFATKHKLETLPAVISICQRETIRSNGVAMMMIMAAAVEIIEPSK